MTNEAAKQQIIHLTLQPNASYYDWASATAQARGMYCQHACQRCEESDLGHVNWSEALAGIDAFYCDEVNRNIKLSGAFGLVFGMIRRSKTAGN